MATLLAAAAMIAVLILPAAASATHDAQFAATSTYQPGCQAKGLFAQPAPTPVGGLNPGFYAYVVTALVGADETMPCPPVVTGVPGGQFTSVSLQWNSVPGASAYNVYRATYNPSTGATGPFTLVQYLSPAFAPGCPRAASTNQNGPAGNANNGNGGGQRCDAHDNNPSTTGAPLTKQVAAATTQAGAAVDMKLTQCIDYGGPVRSACPFSPPPAAGPAIDDPTQAEDANALRTDDLHFPPGLNARPTAAPVCKLSGPAPSLLGSTTLRGSQDPDEDTCPRESLVGNATTLSRTNNSPNTYSLTRGDIYMGQAQAGEAARLFIVLRPNCSAGAPSPYNPGGQVCTQAFGGSGAGGNFVEVEKEFLAAPSTFVRRVDSSGNVTYGIDVRTVTAASGGTLPSTLAAMAPLGPGGSFVTAQEIGVQIHQLTQTLFGTTDQNTADTSDDKTFLTLPTSCGDHSLTADKTTYAHEAEDTDSTNVPTSNCLALEFTPELSATASGTAAEGGHPALDVTVTQSATEAPSESVKVTLPAELGTNLAALSTTCTQTELDADTCPDSKSIGTATADSPISGPLSGKVYLQENPGSLPRLVVKLKTPAGSANTINIDLVGDIDLAGGNRIVNLFPSVPDVPLTQFTLHVNGGDNGLLTNLKDLCKGLGNADGEFTAHSDATATRSVPVGLAGVTCVPDAPTNPGVSKRARVRIVLAKVKSGKPTLKVTVLRGSKSYASRIKSVRLSLPKGLKIKRNDALEARLAVKAQTMLMPITQLIVRTRLLTVDRIPGGPVTKLVERFRRRALKSSGSLRRRGAKARPVFRVRVRTFTKTYNYKVKVKPRS